MYRPKVSFGSIVMTLAASIAFAGCGGDDDGTGPGISLQPDVVAVTPDSGNVGTLVGITGSNFQTGAAVAFGPLSADSVVFVDAGTLLAYAPAGVQRDSVYAVEVTNPGGKSDALPAAYKAVSPVLSALNGVSKPSGNTGSTVILEGKSFGDLLGVSQVFFTDGSGQPVEAAVTLPENWTNEFIVTTVPSAAATGPVWIETPLGMTGSIEFRLLQAATFSPSLINWTETTPLPDASQGHEAVFLPIEGGPGQGNLIYLTGGADGTVSPRNRVAYAEVDASSQLSVWTDETTLPEPRAFHGAAAASPFNALIDTTVAGYLYVIGGIDASGAPTSTVYSAPVNPDRSVGTWTQRTGLPQPLHSMGVALFRSWLYVAGGATTGDVPQREVYRAHIDPDGSLGAWEVQPSLPYPRAYVPLAQFAGVLYTVGGDTAAVAPGDATLTITRVPEIHYNRLDLRTAELQDATWALNPSALIKSSAKHSAIVTGGWMFVSGGLYNGAPNSATEHEFAAINSDATVASFGGATGSETIVGGAGGVPFYHHAAVGYVDAAGAAHVMILGGNDVNNPSTPVANVYFY